MKKIYIAGPISADNPIKMFANIKAGNEAAALLLFDGFAVFSPFLDFTLLFTDFGSDITKAILQGNSMAWVECCDAMLVLPGWETSGGTQREMERAKTLGIPIYFDPEQLVREMSEEEGGK